MPQLFPFADEPVSHDQPRADSENSPSQVPKHSSSNMLDRWAPKLSNWLKKEEGSEPPPEAQECDTSPSKERPGLLGRRISGRKTVTGLPRNLTFKRQNSEKRDRLLPVEPEKDERRALSVGRFRFSSKRPLSPPPVSTPSRSAPDVTTTDGNSIQDTTSNAARETPEKGQEDAGIDLLESAGSPDPNVNRPLSTTGDTTDHESISDGVDEVLIQQELEAKWILNLSMHFRDMSDREKFFITYAEAPNKWRRVTVSCDYRDVAPDSLEADLKGLHYQRDKSAKIYESIRDSLPDIQFYDTVTNLKLQTDDGRLHVHVTEDVNETIPYPPVSATTHLPGLRFQESDINFDSHISGFVYKVTVKGRTYIKKEIPGPDTVEEFLYEVNALARLRNSNSVIKYEGLIVDEKEERIKGLLVSYAEQGALVDLIFDLKNKPHALPWGRRLRWARQIVQGLSEIHEAGFVQGDFTLSNIVVDEHDNAKIIDINRRGCPVGWEPPELTDLIDRNQRVSIYIGVKSDIFQMGMVLWALLESTDEPERQERPLEISRCFTEGPLKVEKWFRHVVEKCLNERPEDRPTPRELLREFRGVDDSAAMPLSRNHSSFSTHRSNKEYIDPSTAVGLEDIDLYRRGRELVFATGGDVTFLDAETNRTSVSYRYGSSAYSIIPDRSGSPTSASALTSHSRRPFDCSPDPLRTLSLHDSEIEGPHILGAKEERWEKVYMDGEAHFECRTSVDSMVKDPSAIPLEFNHMVAPIPVKEDSRVPFPEFESLDSGYIEQTPRKHSHANTSMEDSTPKASKVVANPDETVRNEKPVMAKVSFGAAEVPPIPPLPYDNVSPFDTPLLPHERVSPFDTPLLPHEQLFSSGTVMTPPKPDRKVSLELPAFSRAHADADIATPSSRGSGTMSFQERVHNRRSHDSHLADLETEIMSVPTPAPSQRRDSRPFGPPIHHDSGFHEPEMLSPQNSSPLDWQEKPKHEKIEELKRLEEREERRRKSAEMDEKRVRDEIQEMLRNLDGNTGKLRTDEDTAIATSPEMSDR